MDIIRALFSSRRPIDRTIEKVIDYYAQNEDRLATEIEEYEITDNLRQRSGSFWMCSPTRFGEVVSPRLVFGCPVSMALEKARSQSI